MQAEASTPQRRGLALALVVVASLVAFAAIAAIWVDRQVLNTANWTAASSELLERPVIRDQVAGYLTDQLYANVDVEGALRDALPERAQALAGPISGAFRSQVQQRARDALAREDVQRLWENANREAHLELLRVIDGGGSVASTEGGRVVLNLKALLQETEERAGIGGRAGQVLPDSAARITIMRSDQLGLAQDIGKALKALPAVLVALSLALFGGALLVAPGWRRRALRAYGVGFVAAGAGALAAESLASDAIVDSLAQTAAGEPMVRAVLDIYTPLLEQAATATIGYGIVMIAGAWLAGPTAWAVAVRRTLAPYMREPWLVYCAVALIVVAVLFWWSPTPATRNPVTATVLVALLVLGVEGLRRKTVREFPDADRAATAQRRRELFTRVSAGAAEKARAGSGAVVRKASRFSATAQEEDVRLEQLERLARLRAAGVIDDEDLRAAKARVLGDDNGGDARADDVTAVPPSR